MATRKVAQSETARYGLAGVLGGLLGSSCCALQLLMNVFNLGCLGLAKYLEPYRRLFVVVNLLLVAQLWARKVRWRTALTGAVVTLLLLPYVVELHSHRMSKHAPERTAREWQREIQLVVPSMGCEACRNKILRTMRSTEGVSEVTVDLPTKVVTLQCSLLADVVEVELRAMRNIKSAGFEAKVVDVSAPMSRFFLRQQTAKSKGKPTATFVL
mmetsp:Transcript_13234/g.40680  ORF Transcript_13234/g.40680 Transcript_13234/m.40680 type:complete len:213 (-) Transcript_13234:1380-2018(-)